MFTGKQSMLYTLAQPGYLQEDLAAKLLSDNIKEVNSLFTTIKEASSL